MADRQELLNAMNVIKEHCENLDCGSCPIRSECNMYFDLIDNPYAISPCNWKLENSNSMEYTKKYNQYF